MYTIERFFFVTAATSFLALIAAVAWVELMPT